MNSFDRHLRKTKYGFQIVSSIEFAKLREVVKTERLKKRRKYVN